MADRASILVDKERLSCSLVVLFDGTISPASGSARRVGSRGGPCIWYVYTCTHSTIEFNSYSYLRSGTICQSAPALMGPLLCTLIHLHQPIRTCPSISPVFAARVIYSYVSSRDGCIQNSPQIHPFTIAVTIVFAGPGFIMAQEEPTAAHVELDAGKNIMMPRRHLL